LLSFNSYEFCKPFVGRYGFFDKHRYHPHRVESKGSVSPCIATNTNDKNQTLNCEKQGGDDRGPISWLFFCPVESYQRIRNKVAKGAGAPQPSSTSALHR